MKLNPQDLEKISRLTLEHYDQCSEEFWKGTRHHDVSQNVEALLQHIEGKPPFTILDFGCGPGRDLKAFVERGHNAIGLEGAEHFVTMARAHSGREVWRQDFLQLELPEKYFDGVFANAAVSCPEARIVPRVAGTARHLETGRRAVQFEPSRRQSGGLEQRALLCVSRSWGALMRPRPDSLS